MKDLFENILYLIPIALFIVVRIINARGKSSQQQQQQSQESTKEIGEILRRYREDEPKPVYERQVAEEVYPRTRTPDERKKRAEKKAANAVGKKPKSVPGTLSGAVYSTNIPESPSAVEQREAAITAVVAARSAPPLPVFAYLPRVQQAVVWSEILGRPKAFPEGV
jgi:hypothetical protein